MTLDTAKKSQTETPFLMTTSKAKPGTPLADRVRDQTKELPVAPSASCLLCSFSLHFRSPRDLSPAPKTHSQLLRKTWLAKLLPCPQILTQAATRWLKCLDCVWGVRESVCWCVCAGVCWCVAGCRGCECVYSWHLDAVKSLLFTAICCRYLLSLLHTLPLSLFRSVCVPVYWYLFWPIRLIKQQTQTPDERKSQVLTVLPTFEFPWDIYPRPGNNIAIFSNISVSGELKLILQL